jgi:hypothetical protein
VVNQYPHTAIIKDTNWSTETECESELKCRAETGGNAKKGFNQDDVTPKAVIYFPLPMEPIEIGTSMEVRDGERVVVADTVKQFSPGQLNARIWL